MHEIYDLHIHSVASDGTLTPEEVINTAISNQVHTMALTDHDTVSGLTEANAIASKANINFINGIELSSQWQTQPVHIVGLKINPEHPSILSAIQHLQTLREERGIRIGRKLEKAGIDNALEYAKNIADGGTLTRQHFAQHLLNAGYANSHQDVFKKYLTRNKPGYVSVNWPSLEETISCITQAGGTAVIAHPLRYKITATKLRKMIEDFKAIGGKAIEVVTGSGNKSEIETLSNYAKRYDIAASVGSDFHNNDTPWCQIGKLSPLPKDLKPVWEVW